MEEELAAEEVPYPIDPMEGIFGQPMKPLEPARDTQEAEPSARTAS